MLIWKCDLQAIDSQGFRVVYTSDSDYRLTFRDFVDLCKSDTSTAEDFRMFHSDALASIPFTSFKWETPVATEGLMDSQFEYVVLHSPALDRHQNPEPFKEHLDSPGNDLALTFANLGNTATLIVPAISGTSDVNHCHLAAFLRSCSHEQSNALWQAVGHAMTDRISKKPVWLSTAGGGVAWLHVRLDDRPKYYGYEPYRSIASL